MATKKVIKLISVPSKAKLTNSPVRYHYGMAVLTTMLLLMGLFAQAQSLPAPLLTEQVESYTTTTDFSIPYYPQGTGAIEFRADVSLNGGFTTFLPGYFNKLITNPYFIQVSGLTGGTSYFVRIRAVYPSGTSPNSNVFMVITKPAIMPATDVTTTSFVANCNPSNPLDYYFDVSTSSDFSSFVPGYQFRWSSSPNALVTGLSPNTTYYYRFRVDYGPVMSYNSDYGTVTTLAPVPSPPVVQQTSVYKGIDFLWVIWNPSQYATSYQIDIAYDAEFTAFVPGYNNLSVSAVDMGPYKRHEATGLIGEMTYYFRVRAVNASGVSASSNVMTTTTLGPRTPVATAATYVMATSFRANWNDVASATSYRIDVSTANDFSTFIHYDLTLYPSQSVSSSPNTTYYYRVRSVNAEGTSPSSNVISVTTPSPPPAPMAYAATYIESTQFTANWSPVSGATSYRLQVSPTSNFSTLTFNQQGNYGTSKTVTGLNPGVVYNYRVFAITSAGTSAASNVVTAQTLPAAPLLTEQVDSYTGATWFAIPYYPQAPGAIEFRADVSFTSTFATFLPGYQNTLIDNPYFIQVYGLTGGTPYYVRMRAVYPSGISSNSNVFMVVTKPDILPATDVTMTSFVAGCNPSSPLDYYLDVSTSSDFSTFVPGYQNKWSSGPSVLVTGLSLFTTYYYRFRVDYGSVMSFNSDYGTVTTLPPVPAPPVVEETGAYKGTDFLWVVWTPSAYATFFYLDVAYDSDFENMVSGYNNLLVSGVEMGPYKRFEVAGLQPGTLCYFRVRAANIAGVSANSNTRSTFTNWPDVTGQDKNMIVVRTALESGGSAYSLTTLAQPDDVQLDITYFDDLGRPEQQVSWYASPSGKDIVQPIMYDDYGRQEFKYRPYASDDNKAMYATDAVSEQQAYYTTQYGDALGVSKSIFDDSPLNRITEQGAPGAAWQPDADDSYASMDHTVKSWEETNSTNEVRRWTYTQPSPSYPLGLVNAVLSNGVTLDYYPAGRLYKTKTKDENHHEVIHYSDKNGKTILKRVQAQPGVQAVNDNSYASTYYIYDDFGNLVTVIQPEGVKNLATQFLGLAENVRNDYLKKWAFRYVYDGRKRVTIRQIPGADPIYMLYDKRNRLVLTQDGNQRNKLVKEWGFTKYDALDRAVLTGVYADPANSSAEAMQNIVDLYYENLTSSQSWFETYVSGSASSNVLGYDNKSFPQIQEADCHTAMYYDKYDGYIAPAGYGYTHESLVDPETSQAQETGSAINTLFVKGLVTGMRIRNLGSGSWLCTVNYYDKKYRLVQTISDHQKGKVTVSNILDFTGKVVFTKRNYVVNSVSHYILENPHYDRRGRLLWMKHSVDGGQYVMIVKNKYDESGQLIAKKLHRTAENVPPPGPPVTSDPLVGQPGVTYDDNIVSSQYNNDIAYIANTSVTLRPGFYTNGSAFIARIGYSAEDANIQNSTGETFAQSVDYTYNIRGWLTKINEPDVSSVAGNDVVHDYFGMELAYQAALDGTTADAMYNGNISAMQWSTGAGGAMRQAYGFSYDAMNRLLTAGHSAFKWGSWATENGAFLESIGEYDHNGNIWQLTRKTCNGDPLDMLTYNYTGNLLNYVHDSADPLAGFVNANTGTDDYSYDHNGNLSRDKNKGILNDGDIKYNHLNLPVEVVRGTEKIKYIYNAMGTKLAQEVYDAGGTLVKVTDYIGELIYENNALKIIQHAEGRVLPDGGGWEYQYHLKDHLGNVRVTFTTKEETETTTATVEEPNADEERSQYVRYANMRKVSSPLFDHTNDSDPVSTDGYAQRLSGGENERFGLARSLSVMPGDKITAEVFAKYVDINSEDVDFVDLISAIASQIAAGNTAAGMVVDGDGFISSTASFRFMVENAQNKIADAGTGPKAYLNWLVFDRDYNFIAGKSGYKRLSDDPAEGGSNVLHERLYSPEITIDQAGYVYIYLSNEESSLVEVYFDDFKVEHVKSPVVQMDDYYPFGLTFNSFKREGALENKWKFQGQEHVDDLDLGWDSFKWRNHQPDIGRFFNIDPIAEDYYYNSPYAFSENKVTSHVEIEGLESQSIHLNQEIKKAQKAVENFPSTVWEGLKSLGSAIFNRENADAVGNTSDVVQVVTENSKDLKGINKITKVLGPAADGASIVLDATTTDFDNPAEVKDFVENTASTVVSAATGPAAPATAVVINDSKKDDGVTNVKNLQQNYSLVYRSQQRMIQQRIEYLRKSSTASESNRNQQTQQTQQQSNQQQQNCSDEQCN